MLITDLSNGSGFFEKMFNRQYQMLFVIRKRTLFARFPGVLHLGILPMHHPVHKKISRGIGREADCEIVLLSSIRGRSSSLAALTLHAFVSFFLYASTLREAPTFCLLFACRCSVIESVNQTD